MFISHHKVEFSKGSIKKLIYDIGFLYAAHNTYSLWQQHKYFLYKGWISIRYIFSILIWKILQDIGV